MLKTKKDIDAHVRDIFSKLQTEEEKALRCFSIARSYLGIREYDIAARYLDMYIKQDKNPDKLGDAYKLQGDIYQEGKNEEEALESYKKSYNLSKSRIALNRVCDLLHAGYGKNETSDSKNKWFELQKIASSSRLSNILESTPRRETGPMMSSPSHLGAPSPAASGRRERETRLFQNGVGTNGHSGHGYQAESVKERKLDDVLERILEQNQTLMDQNIRLISSVTRISDEVKDLRHSVSALQFQASSLARSPPVSADKVDARATNDNREGDAEKERAEDSVPTSKFTPVKLSPAVEVKKADETRTVEVKKADKTPAAAATSKTTTSAEPSPLSSFSFASTAAAKLPGFGDLANQNKDSGFAFGGTSTSSLSFGQLGSTAPIFGSFVAKKPEPVAQAQAASQDHEESAEEFVPTAEFTPVIPLPPLVEVKKGDEDDNLIFEVRAKLFRWVPETKEWKERGIGNIKLLQHKEDKSKVRVVMWREQIHKLACNHRLQNDTTIDFLQNKKTTLTWSAVDFSEEEPKTELFACKFGKEEQSLEFRRHFEKLVAEVASSSSEVPRSKETATTVTATPVANTTAQVPLFELFKKPEGSWTCSGCYMNNTKETLSCPSCATAQPGVTLPSEPAASFTPSTLPQMSFGFGFKAPPPASRTAANLTSTTTAAEPVASPFSTFSFAGTAAAKLPGFGDLANQNKDSGFAFGSTSTSSPSFGQLGTSTPIFGSFAAKKAEPLAQAQAASEDQEEHAEEFVPTAEFAPVIPLPPLVEVKKGDEDDNLIFETRAKLFRWVPETKEWKERGIGNIKLLQHKEDKSKARVVMWREQIHKLACNHWLQKDTTIDFLQNKKTTLTWSAVDFSEEESKNELFACKFGKEEQSLEFRRHFEELVAQVAASSSEVSSPKDTATTATATPAASSTSQVPLSELFKKPEGSWTCSGCYMNNTKETLSCPSCATTQPGVTLPSEPAVSLTPSTLPQISFGFGFTTPSASATAATIPSTATTSAEPSPFSSFSFASTAAAKLPGFGDLANQNKDSGFAFGGTNTSSLSFGQLGTTTPIFGSFVTKKPESVAQAASEDHEEHAEEFVPTAEFTPVIPLPPLVEVKKGDEDDNLIFETRAKLFRWVPETQEWKERGIGNIKLLQHKEDKSKARVVMWREQIHKLACNHRLQKDMTIEFFQKKKTSLTWSAVDFSEEEAKNELFACKFGKEEQSLEFRRHFEALVAEVAASSSEVSSVPKDKDTATTETVTPVASSTPQVPLSELFKKPEGSWTCSGCYMNNTKESLSCPSCATAQPGVTLPSEPAASVTPSTLPQMSFGFGFQAPPPASGTAATMSSTATTAAETVSSSSPFSSFSFANTAAAKLPGFGDLANQNKDSGFAFGGTSTSSLSFGQLGTTTPIFGSFTTKKTEPGAQAASEDHEEHAEEFVPTAEFAPVIPLPPLVEVKKGDEDDNLIFETRAKLFRWVPETKEWKERGIGNIKLLQHKEDKSKARVVMWREQIHKLACNHRLQKDMTIDFFQKKTSLTWSAVDFSEEEAKNELFACKFGKEEQSLEFRRHFERLVAEVASSSSEASSPKNTASTATTTPVANPTAQVPLSELFKKADGSWTCSGCYIENAKESAKCPACGTAQPGQASALESFSFTLPVAAAEASSAQQSECPGCIGCDPDSFDFSRLDSRQLPVYPEQSLTPEEYLAQVGVEKPSPSPTPAFAMTSFPMTSPLSFNFVNSLAQSQGSAASSPIVAAHQPSPAGAEDEEDYEEDEYEDNEDEPPMFEAVATLSVRYPGNPEYEDLGEGIVSLLYDNEMYCARFHFRNDDERELDHIVASDTHLQSIGNTSFAWTGLSESDDGTYVRLELQASFGTEELYAGFHDRFTDGQDIASQAGITEHYLVSPEEAEEQ